MFEKLGFGEIVLILIVVLLIFGPSKLPALGKSIGEGMREFRKSMKEVSGESDAKPGDSSTDKKA